MTLPTFPLTSLSLRTCVHSYPMLSESAVTDACQWAIGARPSWPRIYGKMPAWLFFGFSPSAPFWISPCPLSRHTTNSLSAFPLLNSRNINPGWDIMRLMVCLNGLGPKSGHLVQSSLFFTALSPTENTRDNRSPPAPRLIVLCLRPKAVWMCPTQHFRPCDDI